jgi:non-heme chloroperoxidase
MRFLLCIAGCVLLLLAIAGALAAFFPPAEPKPCASITDPFTRMNLAGLPNLERFPARDGAMLSYRYYPAAGDRAVVLVHGSSASSRSMHQLALALQRDGAAVIALDMRGHGANQPHGDIAYLGQLEDDMEDFLHAAELRYAGKKITLLGFSSGGGFALRIAGGRLGARFDRYVLLSPFLDYKAPTVRPYGPSGHDSPWCSVAVLRIVGLSILNGFHIHNFDHLAVLGFPVPSGIEAVTTRYSFVMQKNFGVHPDYKGDIRKTPKPMQVLVGGADELFFPEKFAEIFHAERPEIPVEIVPGMNHADMVTNPVAIEAIVRAVRKPSAGR